MNKDVLIVDDNEDILNFISLTVRGLGYVPFGYKSFYEAIKFVKEKKEGFYACFVDMKPINFIPNIIDNNMKDLLKTPEEIFSIIKSKEWERNFYFISAFKSNHDEDVLKETSADFIIKMIVYVKN